MNTLSKEHNSKLKELRDELICWQGYYDPVKDKEQHEMFITAADAVAELLALRKEREAAVPALHRWRRVSVEPYGPYPWHYENFTDFSKPVEGIEDEYFYAAPPAQPVAVPDEITFEQAILEAKRLSPAEAYMKGRRATAAQLVAVPDAVDYSDLDAASQDREVIEAIAECKGWNACRAAMLAAAPGREG